MWQKFKNSLGVVAAALIGILGLLFMIEKNQKEGVEEKLLNKDTKDKDDELKQQQDALAQDSQKAEDAATKEKEQTPSQQEILDDLNKL